MTALRTIARQTLGNLLGGFVLDTILGPAEDFEYVSRTAPSEPAPNIT